MSTTAGIVVGIVILLVAASVGFAKRHKTVKAMPTYVGFGITFAILALIGSYLADQANRRTTDQCIARVDRSYGSRAYNLFLIDTIDKAFGGKAHQYTDPLRVELDNDLPPIDYATCYQK